jgi:hypothetical protein
MNLRKLSSTVACAALMLAGLVSNPLEAGFSNTGEMESPNLSMQIAGTLENDGVLIGNESAYLECETLTGTGYIIAPLVEIKANIFAYTGTIECEKQCVITTSQAFEEDMFTKAGEGEFIVIVDPEYKAKEEAAEAAEAAEADATVETENPSPEATSSRVSYKIRMK